MAAPGDLLFADDMNDTNLPGWSTTGDVDSSNDMAEEGRSMRLGGGPASATSGVIDAAVAAARLEAWIGSGSGRNRPAKGVDLRVEYRDVDGNWQLLEVFPGGGSGGGQTFTPQWDLPPDALHANLRIRFVVTGGRNGRDYWYVDSVRLTDTSPPPTTGPVFCEDFEDGLGAWSIDDSGGGDAGLSTEVASSPTHALRTAAGHVEVTSPAIDLGGAAGTASLSLWIRSGDGFFAPTGEADLLVQYLDADGNWVTLDTIAGGGAEGQVVTPVYTLPAPALHAGFRVRIVQADGDRFLFFIPLDYWYVDDVCVTAEREPLAWHFEESAWTGAGGEVLEASGSGLDGTVLGGATNDDQDPALPGNPGTCAYGDFDGVDDRIEIPDDPALDLDGAFTIAAWIKLRSLPPDLYTIVSKDTNYEFHIDSAGRVYWWWEADNFRTTGFSVSPNAWHHVAVTFRSGRQVIYVDGLARATHDYAGALPQNDLPLFIGADWNFFSERAFDGLIDEVTILPRELTQAEVQALMAETHPCPVAGAEFLINHDGFGIHCAPETILVSVIDPVSGTPRIDYDADVVLDTQNGSGSWSLVSGAGVLDDGTAGDGVATYDWALGESQVAFALTYPQGPPAVDIDVWQASDTGIRDTDAEGLLAFSPSGFTLTAGPLANPPAAPIVPFAAAQTAAVPFTVHITAYGQTADDPECGVIEGYSGNKNLTFWFDYVDPASGSRSYTVGGTAIPAAETAAAPQTVAFTNGQARVTAKYKDVGKTKLYVKDATPADPDLPTGIRGATADFVVRPDTFVLSDIRDAGGGTANPQAADANGAVFIAAGAPFRVTVTALDAEGDPTPSYGREQNAESVQLVPQLVAPLGGANPAVSAATGFTSFSGGSATGAFTWSEVGIISLVPSVDDGDYLGSGDVSGAPSENVGRFVPDHFTTVLDPPTFATACTTGGYTYLGEPFEYSNPPVITATARAADGRATQNYAGLFFKLSDTTVQNVSYTATSGTLDLSGLPSPDPVVTELPGGSAKLTFSSGSGLKFERGTPAAPFDAEIRLSVDVVDADGVAALANPVTFGTSGGIDFDAGPEMRYGRVRIANAFGSERVDLAVPMVSEYFAGPGTGFVVNDADGCTADVSLAYVGFTENLDPGETCVLDIGLPGASNAGCPTAAPPLSRFAEPPAGGSFNLWLAAPGDGNTGSVLLRAEVPEWLRFDWDETTSGDENPAAQAAFGLFPGSDRQIYTREVF